MHMADALLAPTVGLAFDAASVGLVAAASRRVVREPGYERRAPLMGVLGAFVFAAQLVNFAIPGTGSSGHLAGGLLLAVLVGPSAAFLVMVSVLMVQALVFGDGGLLALGCNVFNLGFWPSFVGIALYRQVSRAVPGPRGVTLGAVAASLVSLELGALGVVAQTALSGRLDLPLRDFAVLMVGIHAPIAVVEGLATAGIVQMALRLAPERLDAVPAGGRQFSTHVPLLLVFFGAALFLATVGLAWASALPDGLAWSLGTASAALGQSRGWVNVDAPLAGPLGALLAGAVVVGASLMLSRLRRGNSPTS